MSSDSALRTLITKWGFFKATFLIIPLSSVPSVVDVDLYTELCGVVVVGLMFCPWIVTNPSAVITNPSPSFILVVFGDSNPEIWAWLSHWQQINHMVVLFLVLDHHHVCVASLAEVPGLGPVQSDVWVMISPSQGILCQGPTWKIVWIIRCHQFPHTHVWQEQIFARQLFILSKCHN